MDSAFFESTQEPLSPADALEIAGAWARDVEASPHRETLEAQLLQDVMAQLERLADAAAGEGAMGALADVQERARAGLPMRGPAELAACGRFGEALAMLRMTGTSRSSSPLHPTMNRGSIHQPLSPRTLRPQLTLRATPPPEADTLRPSTSPLVTINYEQYSDSFLDDASVFIADTEPEQQIVNFLDPSTAGLPGRMLHMERLLVESSPAVRPNASPVPAKLTVANVQRSTASESASRRPHAAMSQISGVDSIASRDLVLDEGLMSEAMQVCV